MYFAIGILLAAAIVFSVVNRCRRKRIIRRICGMSECEKYCRLNELANPWGFSYLPSQDIMTSVADAWQREFGYCSLFDKTASRFNMVFDCEPVYFDYLGRTWRIEFWKGQYGINVGGEIGVYYADTVLAPEEYDKAHFHSADDDHLLFLSMELYDKECLLFEVSQWHWWLTGFCMGSYSEPGNLEMRASVTFPNQEMLCRFVDGLRENGYGRCEVNICEDTVSFLFSLPRRVCAETAGCFGRRKAQWKNRWFCRIYCQITRPFSSTLDRLLYLYLTVPFAFRRMFRFKRNRKQKIRWRKRRKI